MALTINDAMGVMTSDAACAVGRRCSGRCDRHRLGSAWHVTGHGGRLLTRNDAMTALLLADPEASGESDGPQAGLYRQELGLV
ncbi:MAG: hypothetical protein ABJB47_10335 [Actinomycetota bacterium]